MSAYKQLRKVGSIGQPRGIIICNRDGGGLELPHFIGYCSLSLHPQTNLSAGSNIIVVPSSISHFQLSINYCSWNVQQPRPENSRGYEKICIPRLNYHHFAPKPPNRKNERYRKVITSSIIKTLN